MPPPVNTPVTSSNPTTQLPQLLLRPLETSLNLTANIDSFAKAPQSRPASWYTEKTSELATREAREQFCASWDELQSAKQLHAMDACSIEINTVTLKGEDALALLSVQALAAYFQAVQQLKELSAATSGVIVLEDEGIILQKKSKDLEVKINALEEIIDLEGIKKVWKQKDKSELTKLFEAAAGIFWKNAVAQQKSSNSFLADISPEAINPPTLLKQISAKLFAHIASTLTPYSWNMEAQLYIGNFSVNKKILPFDMGKDLPTGLISLASKPGRDTVKKYFHLLEQIGVKKNTHAASLELDKKAYDVKSAMKFLAERSILCFTAMAKRYILLHERLKTEATKNELAGALRTASIKPNTFKKLAPIREELKSIKEELSPLGEFAFQPLVREYWKKSAELRGQDPEAISQKLQILPLIIYTESESVIF